jgi:hypothetical protein
MAVVVAAERETLLVPLDRLAAAAAAAVVG